MKILIVGLGSVGQRHAKNLKELMRDQVEISAYRVRNNPVSLEFEITIYDKLWKALQANPDGVIISNLPHLHMDVAKEVAARGIPFLVEKPIAASLEGVDEVISMVEEQNLPALVGYQMRFHPDMGMLWNYVRGLTPPLISVWAETGSYLPKYHPYEDYRNMYESHAEYGGGVILSQIHEFDYIQHLFGTPNRIFTSGGHVSDLDIMAEDTATTLLHYANEVPIVIHQDFLQDPPRRFCRIVGKENTIFVDFLKGIDRNEMFMKEIQHFIACITREAAPIVTLREGTVSLIMALKAKQSLKSGESILYSSEAAYGRFI